MDRRAASEARHSHLSWDGEQFLHVTASPHLYVCKPVLPPTAAWTPLQGTSTIHPMLSTPDRPVYLLPLLRSSYRHVVELPSLEVVAKYFLACPKNHVEHVDWSAVTSCHCGGCCLQHKAPLNLQMWTKVSASLSMTVIHQHDYRCRCLSG